MKVVQEKKSPTPKFFRVLRMIGLALLTEGSASVAAPMKLPDKVLITATYLTIAGGVLTAMSHALVSRKDASDDCNQTTDQS